MKDIGVDRRTASNTEHKKESAKAPKKYNMINSIYFEIFVNNKLSIFWGRPLIKFEDFWNRGNREHYLYEYQMLNQLNNMVDCVFVKVFFLN